MNKLVALSIFGVLGAGTLSFSAADASPQLGSQATPYSSSIPMTVGDRFTGTVDEEGPIVLTAPFAANIDGRDYTGYTVPPVSNTIAMTLDGTSYSLVPTDGGDPDPWAGSNVPNQFPVTLDKLSMTATAD